MQTLQQAFQHTETGGSFSPERLQKIERVLVEDHHSDMPWYLRFIIGVGAWLASIFFIGFFLVMIGYQQNHREIYGISGLVILALSVLLFHQKLGLFVNQCCLAFSLAGQFMIYFGFLPEQHGTLGGAVILSLSLAAVLYGLYPDVLQRLITCVAALQITLAWVYLGNDGDNFFTGVFAGQDVVFWASSYWVLQLVALVGCFILVSRWSAHLAPLGHALVVSLAAWQVENLGGMWLHNPIHPVWASNHVATTMAVSMWPYYLRPISTAVMLFGVVTWAAGGVGSWRRFTLPFAGFACTLVAIIWFGAGGVLLPLLLITLGFFVESRVVLGIGLILLPIFLSGYYYNLHLDLLAKSVALIGTGFTLLLLRAGLRRWLKMETKEAS